MPRAQSKSTPAKRRSNKALQKETLVAQGSSRQDRRKADTRQRLVAAALVVMSRKGIEAASIADITDQADVGCGSFYNHFRSKEEIAHEVFSLRAEKLAEELDSVLERVGDPALSVSIVQRWFVERVRKDPVWGWFFLHASAVLPIVEHTFHTRLCRDLEKMHKLINLPPKSIDMAATITLAAIMGTINQALEGTLAEEGPSIMVELVLRMYGLPQKEAHKLAFTPLPAWLTKGAH